MVRAMSIMCVSCNSLLAHLFHVSVLRTAVAASVIANICRGRKNHLEAQPDVSLPVSRTLQVRCRKTDKLTCYASGEDGPDRTP